MSKNKPSEQSAAKISAVASVFIELFKLLQKVVKWGAIAAMVMFVAPEVGKFAGKNTVASFTINADTDSTVVIKPELPNIPAVSNKEVKKDDKKGNPVPAHELTPFVEWVAWSILTIGTFVAAWYARTERRVKRRKVEQLTEELSKRDRQIDPKKGSSGLLKNGATHPRDKL